MDRENSTAAPGGAEGFIIPLAPRVDSSLGGGMNNDGPAPPLALVGGKGRSLLRLAELGLPTPAGFAITPALFEALRSVGPPLPAALSTVADLAALDHARRALEQMPFPPGFGEALGGALADAEKAAGNGVVPGQFAVRSSADGEDTPGALAAGIYASRVPVFREDVASAVREVLASFLSPAAWVYADRRGQTTGSPRQPPPGGAVLIHCFHAGEAWGTAAVAAAAPGTVDPALGSATGAALTAPVTVEIAGGALTPSARASLEAGARTAAATYGSVELEWVAHGEGITFLQMRAYQAVPPPHADESGQSVPGAIASAGGALGSGWSWDAAHNPAPLSPAQTGLVELVDAQCRTTVRQAVADGYLFWRPNDAFAGAARTPGLSEDEIAIVDPSTAFEDLRASVERALDGLGAEPQLEAALSVFVRGYEPLFGDVAASCAGARAALAAFLQRHQSESLDLLPVLLSDVPSVAERRRAAVADLLASTTTSSRQKALENYLLLFGDESPRWDVAEPTLREAPQRLLLLAAAAPAGAHPSPSSGSAAAADAQSRWREAAAVTSGRLPSAAQPRFQALLTAARSAVSVGEDDDALFARLQARVRQALLAVGRRLVDAGRIDTPDDVFYLPLTVTRDLADGPTLGSPATADLRGMCAAARDAVHRAIVTPPSGPSRAGRSVVRGRAGAGGRLIGRAVHHPALEPLGADAVLIAATLLPTELPLLSPGALVVETGHVLGHVAAQARERGIPAVVAAAGAVAAIPNGARVLVDGDRGEIVLLGGF